MGSKTDAVLIDRVALATEIMQQILDARCSRPAFIGNDEERLHVFRDVMKSNGLFRDELCKASEQYCIESGYQAMREMLQLAEIPDVVYAATDMVAIGVYRAIYEHGLSVSDDIQVIGTNDISSARHMSPSLTTMRLFPFEMGETSVDLVIELKNGRKCRKNVYISHEFVVRDSFRLS